MDNYLFYISENLDKILLTLFISATIVQLFYYLVIYRRFLWIRRGGYQTESLPVSVIICARNEAANLRANLPEVLDQEYPEYEVIVVDDCSHDETAEVLGQYLKKYKNLRTTSILEDKKFTHGKKLALTVGIKAAKYEHLLFTDADCRPASNKWVQNMQRNFLPGKSIVLGYGGYEKRKGLLNNYIRWDTLTIAIQYFSYALYGKPYMGVGRNMAYLKSLFFNKKGYANHYHLISGDDDLFVNENGTRENVAVEYSPQAHTISAPETSFTRWFNQKARHVTTSRYYKGLHKRMLGLEYLSRAIFYGLFIWLLATGVESNIVLATFGVRLLVFLLFTKKAMMLLNEKNLFISSLFFDPYSLVINFIIHISNVFRIKTKKWK